MRLWKTCGKPVDVAVDNFVSKVIHNLFHRIFHRFSTGFAQVFFLIIIFITGCYRLIPKFTVTTTITTILKI